jgi:Uncharacterized protein conserved in bacteria
VEISELDKALKMPFEEKDIEWRLQSCGKSSKGFYGKCLAYVTSRAIQERLDAVAGPDNWQCKIHKEGDAYLCELSIRVTHSDGTTEFISRTDGADATDIEPVKGGISSAIKRAASLWGIGRYLYNIKDNWAVIKEDGKYYGKTKQGDEFRWDPPKLAEEFLPPLDEKEFESLKQSVLDFINVEIIKGEQVEKAENYIKDKNISKLKEIVSWCKRQEKKGA